MKFRSNNLDYNISCISDLKMKEVINIADGKRLGTITDVEIDIDTGRLTAIVVPGTEKFLGIFGRREDLVIPWGKISRIGSDVILVESTIYSDIKPIDK
ncbi:YlmC/YmxH family sporulation protein [Dendrosporobacter sp. 1207_IL3150]|uniref:YlmC/YmxH family sporulation protein n=1 Tax=Dendrosporobacter sp. 1207_IL3150 TaxID=3084054 RepID=UPI002FDA43E1